MANEKARYVAFTIVWDGSKQAFAVLDEDKYVLALSPDKKMALALAIKDAKLAELAGVRVSVLSQKPNGELRREWESAI